MNDDLPFRELAARALHQLEEVFLVGVDALVLQEAEEVEGRVVLLPVRDEVRPLRIVEEAARREAVVDALELLDDDATGAHVEVADFGGTLIPVRQADSLAAAIEQAVRITRAKAIDDRRLGEIGRIALGALVHTPTVTDNQNYRSHLDQSPYA